MLEESGVEKEKFRWMAIAILKHNYIFVVGMYPFLILYKFAHKMENYQFILRFVAGVCYAHPANTLTYF
jgi:hypothetical protein